MIKEAYCNESAILQIIYLVKMVFNIARIAVPCILIVMAMLDIVKLIISKDVVIKTTISKIVKRICAATFVFLVPSILNIVLNILGNTTNIELSSCWVKATKENIASLKVKEEKALSKERDKNKNESSKENMGEEIRKNLVFNNSTSKGGSIEPVLDQDSKGGACVSIPPYSNGGAAGEAVVNEALKYVGVLPYVWGGTSLQKGADCSGFTQAIYAKFGVHINRTSSAQLSNGSPVASLSEARAGDLILYKGHVAIYDGHGGVVHASSRKEGTKHSPNAAYRTIKGIRRIAC